jgi:hypothetical protein
MFTGDRYRKWRGQDYILGTKAENWKQAKKLAKGLRELGGINVRITRGDVGDEPYYLWVKIWVLPKGMEGSA